MCRRYTVALRAAAHAPAVARELRGHAWLAGVLSLASGAAPGKAYAAAAEEKAFLIEEGQISATADHRDEIVAPAPKGLGAGFCPLPYRWVMPPPDRFTPRPPRSLPPPPPSQSPPPQSQPPPPPQTQPQWHPATSTSPPPGAGGSTAADSVRAAAAAAAMQRAAIRLLSDVVVGLYKSNPIQLRPIA
jgi:hypothetical protein